MEVFQVGGCVRDRLLGKTPKDIDWVVVGSSPEEMLAKGYAQVGRSFPVYLHPETSEEYALARTEKLLDGSFQVQTVSVSLADDLLRRDLTINALALSDDGTIIDPYGGCVDLAERILRPVSQAFMEDPLRILRVARFRATLGGDWSLHPNIFRYAQVMGEYGRYKEIPRERVYCELSKALMSDRPSVFFNTLRDMHVLHEFFPEIYKMLDVFHDSKYHMEGSVYNHTMLALDKCERSISIRTAVLFHDVGKVGCKLIHGTFHGHSGEDFVLPVFNVIKSYRFPSYDLKLAEYVALNHHRWQAALCGEMSDKKLLKLILGIREEKFLYDALTAFFADMTGRFGVLKVTKYTRAQMLLLWRVVTKYKTDLTDLNVEQIKQKMYRERLNVLKGYMDVFSKEG